MPDTHLALQPASKWSSRRLQVIWARFVENKWVSRHRNAVPDTGALRKSVRLLGNA